MARILIINNDMDTMSLLKNWLEKKQHEVMFTGNKEEALKMISDFNPSLLLVDVLQNDIIHRIKNDRDMSRIPIVLMTGHSLRHEALSMAADDVIEKPFSPYLLEKKIARLVIE